MALSIVSLDSGSQAQTTVEDDDRTCFVPKHGGPNVFPNSLFWGRLVRLAHKQNLLAVRDVTFGYIATYQQLLTDVLYFRNVLYSTLDLSISQKLDRDEEVFINLLGPGGYEFAVAFLALMALGAVVVPLSPDLPVKEATYFATKCHAVAVVASKSCLELARKLQVAIRSETSTAYSCIDIAPHLQQKMLKPEEFMISSGTYSDMNKSGLIIFSSGTTGPPKGAVKRRGFLIDVAMLFSEQFNMKEGDLVLHVLPVHHATGVTLTLLPFLWVGGTIEFRSGGFNPAWTWDRISKGDLTFFSGVPTIYMRLMAYYEQNISNLPKHTQMAYLKGVGDIESMLCGTSALPRPLQEKWTKMRNGRPILTRYGLTEAGSGFSVTPWDTGVPDGSVGTKTPGVDVKLSSYPEGEILMRSPIMFSKYVFDRKSTSDSLDSDGYFKTGDIARKEGDYYFILGRASVDIIKSGGYKISALDVEREILGLDYISEVMVVGIEDEEFGQRVAAAIVLKPNTLQQLSIERLRTDLRKYLTGYKMPTLLCVVNELKKTATGKVSKKVLSKELFGPGSTNEIQVWSSRKHKL